MSIRVNNIMVVIRETLMLESSGLQQSLVRRIPCLNELAVNHYEN